MWNLRAEIRLHTQFRVRYSIIIIIIIIILVLQCVSSLDGPNDASPFHSDGCLRCPVVRHLFLLRRLLSFRLASIPWGSLTIVIYRVKSQPMDLREVGGGCGDWMELAQDRDRWQALVITVMNFRVPKMQWISWLTAETVSFSRRTLLHGVSK